MNVGLIRIQYLIKDCMPPKQGFTNDMTTFNRDKAYDYLKQDFKVMCRQVICYSANRAYPETRWERWQIEVKEK